MSSITLELLGGPLDGDTVVLQFKEEAQIGFLVNLYACGNFDPTAEEWGPASYEAGTYVLSKQLADERFTTVTHWEATWQPA